MIRIVNLEFAPRRRVGLARTGCHHKGSITICSLAQFDVADIRQVKNSLGLQLKLARVQSPESFTKASTIAAVDLRYPLIDCSNVASIVEVELHQCQEQRDHRAEQKDADEKAQPNATAEVGQRAPRPAASAVVADGGANELVRLDGLAELVAHVPEAFQGAFGLPPSHGLAG